MIDKQTVFILGSGSSSPYGFPTDTELRERIIKDFEYDYPLLHYNNDSPKYASFEKNKRKVLARDFVERLIKTRGVATIDEFISINKKKYKSIGKISIQHYLLEYENICFPNIEHNMVTDWFEIVLRKLLQECIAQNNPQSLHVDNITFLTFNYDRLIESLFIKTFINLFRDVLKEKEIKGQIDDFTYRIIHLYGSLGCLPQDWKLNSSKVVGFGEKIKDIKRVEDTIKNIRLINDRFNDNKRIRHTLFNAKKIYFLGNGYIEKNMKFLDLKSNLNFDDPPQIYGTYYQKGINDINKLKRQYFNFTKKIPEPKIEPMNCKELIEKYF